MRRHLSLPNAILAALALGILAGAALVKSPLIAKGQPLQELLSLGGDLFKQLITMVIMPLVVFSLIGGMMSIGDLRKLGRIAFKTVVLYAITALLACLVAVGLVNAIQPGKAVSPERRDEIAKQYEAKQKELAGSMTGEKGKENRTTLWKFVRSIVPANIVDSISKGQMLPVICFSLLFGLTGAAMEGRKREHLQGFVEAVGDTMIGMVRVVMWAAPVGVFCLITLAVSEIGLSVLKALGLYALTVTLGLLIQFIVVYGGAIRLLTRLRFIDFLRACRPALATAFSTSSSAASLPVNMECVSKRLNVSTSVTSFVLPIGTTVNMDGTAIMQSVAAVFIAQLYGIELGFTAQMAIILTAMLAAVGTAPVPSAGIAMLVLILEPLGIPLEGLALIWAVDRPLDMMRTVVNVVGDGVAAAAVGASEGEDVRYVPAPEGI